MMVEDRRQVLAACKRKSALTFFAGVINNVHSRHLMRTRDYAGWNGDAQVGNKIDNVRSDANKIEWEPLLMRRRTFERMFIVSLHDIVESRALA